MTQPPSPSPSAAALALMDQLRDMLNFTWSIAGNVLTFDSTRAARAIDAFAAQAVAAERAKPSASDLERACSLVGTWQYASADLDELITIIAAALAERGRVERERLMPLAEKARYNAHMHPGCISVTNAVDELVAAIRNQDKE